MAGSVNRVGADRIGEMARRYVGGDSLADISRLLNVPISTVRARLIEAGVEMRSARTPTKATLRKLSEARRGKSRTFTDEWRRNISAARTRHADKFARGVSVKPSGYVEFTRGAHKGRLVHVVTMEARLGRRLLPDESVHHIDGDRQNNDQNNLALVTRAGHARLHRREIRLSKGGIK